MDAIAKSREFELSPCHLVIRSERRDFLVPNFSRPGNPAPIPMGSIPPGSHGRFSLRRNPGAQRSCLQRTVLAALMTDFSPKTAHSAIQTATFGPGHDSLWIIHFRHHFTLLTVRDASFTVGLEGGCQPGRICLFRPVARVAHGGKAHDEI